MNRLERLINLVAALLAADRALTREELFERVPGYDGSLETRRRAFERDKEALRGMGVPLTLGTVTTRDGDEVTAYRVRRDQYELPDPDLDPDELSALHVALATVRLDGATGGGATLWKLGGAVEEGATGPATAPPGVDLAGNEHLPALFEAVAVRAPVTFSYRAEVRTVDPFRIAFRGGRWYLAGHDHGRGAPRSFRVDRFESPPVAGEPGSFTRPAAITEAFPKPWEMGDEEPVDATLLVEAEQAPWVEAEVGTHAVRERREDGSVVVSVRVTNREAFLGFAASLLDGAEIVAPPELRDAMVAWLEAMVP